MTERKLATIERIVDIQPIPDADAIEVATVRGWKVVVKRGEFNVGDLVIYFEIDSWIPTELAPFLSKGQEPREYEGIKGERLRTVRLRGQVSQGLILPGITIKDSPVYENRLFVNCPFDNSLTRGGLYYLGADLTEMLRIKKYDPPVPACLAGVMKGPWPSAVPKTDQERCLSGGTMVSTEDGNISIKELCETNSNKRVWSFNHETNELELNPIIGHSVMTKKKGWVKITTKSGKIITATYNHKIWCNDINAYRDAQDIEVGQQIITKTV